MPRPFVDGTWGVERLSSGDAGVWMREILHLAGFSKEALAKVGMHSPKHTLLSWCAKHGVKRSFREDLGGHVRSSDGSVAVYSRDLLAAPLSALEKVIRDVGSGRFDPSATRAGMFRPGGQDVQEDEAEIFAKKFSDIRLHRQKPRDLYSSVEEK